MVGITDGNGKFSGINMPYVSCPTDCAIAWRKVAVEECLYEFGSMILDAMVLAWFIQFGPKDGSFKLLTPTMAYSFGYAALCRKSFTITCPEPFNSPLEEDGELARSGAVVFVPSSLEE